MGLIPFFSNILAEGSEAVAEAAPLFPDFGTFGPAIAAAFRAPFALGDSDRLLDLCARAKLDGAEVLRRDGYVASRCPPGTPAKGQWRSE